jgi:hypothetical protein
VAQNIAAGVVGLFIWPVWFGMDFQGAAGKEVDALNSRQQYLATLAEERNCGAFAAPVRVASSPQAVAPAAQSPFPPPVAPAPPSISAASPAASDVLSNPTAAPSN